MEWVCEKHFLKGIVWDDIIYFYPDIWCSDCAKIAELKLFWEKLGAREQIKHKEQNIEHLLLTTDLVLWFCQNYRIKIVLGKTLIKEHK